MDPLEGETSEFFRLHWPAEWGQRPEWSPVWDMRSGIQNAQLSGVYALLGGPGVLYVGKGDRAMEAGVARRLSAHVIDTLARGGPYAIKPVWKDRGVTELRTLAMQPSHQYLIPALESFLIERLRPALNRRR